MKRGFWLFLVLALTLASTYRAYATSYSTLQTDFAQGGNPTDKRCIIGSGQLYVGPCRILSVNLFSSTAGDRIGVYDTVDPTYPITDLEFELGTSANNSNSPPYHPQAPFINGIRVLSTSSTAVTTVVFDY